MATMNRSESDTAVRYESLVKTLADCFLEEPWAGQERAENAVRLVLDAMPDGWAKVDDEWVQITSDGVGYGEFDRKL